MDVKELYDFIQLEFKELRNDLKDIRKELSHTKQDVSWIKGKLEGRSEMRHLVISSISVIAAVVAILISYFKNG